MKTQTNMKLSYTWRAPIPAVFIMLASDEECNQVISNCNRDFEILQEFMESINLLDLSAAGELLIVVNCTNQLKEMMIDCERRLDKSVKDNTTTVEVYTSTIAHRDR